METGKETSGACGSLMETGKETSGACGNYRASGRSRKKKAEFRGIFSGKFAEKTVDFAGISREFSRPVSLKNDR